MYNETRCLSIQMLSDLNFQVEYRYDTHATKSKLPKEYRVSEGKYMTWDVTVGGNVCSSKLVKLTDFSGTQDNTKKDDYYKTAKPYCKALH